ncbi:MULTISPECIES: hypothetical protein [Haloarcula]|uniref:Uncharacterized protein n=3 Tax=Haloarcula TaxID=2237 RepID=A0A830F369_9EURY|nr:MULTISPECIES: hypothetical protein [Haloarcula]EMA31505.1 hypothetical protein C444_07920 [Haloarcula japonica DSM 6131]GGK79797.1 hypothetical protein GCM10009067_35180 [Haloarcula sebkhae]
MPIDLDSDAWKDATTYDPLETEINSLFRDHQDQALSITEIESHLHENHAHLFPADLVGKDAVDGAKAARQSIVATLLERMYWRSKVTFRRVSPEDEADAGLYFTSDGTGIFPIAEIDEVKDPDPDSPFGTLSGRFREVEDEINEEVSDLEERVDWLEFRVREELGAY